MLSPRLAPETKKSNAYFHPPLSALTARKGSSGLPLSMYGMPRRSAARAAGLPTVGTIGPMMATALSLVISVSTFFAATLPSLLSS